MQTYAGINLHSTNSYIGIINQDDKRLHSQRYGNNLKQILKVLKKAQKPLQGIVVESTYICQDTAQQLWHSKNIG